MLCEVNGHVTHQLEIDHRLGAQPAPTSKLKLVHLVRLAILKPGWEALDSKVGRENWEGEVSEITLPKWIKLHNLAL